MTLGTVSPGYFAALVPRNSMLPRILNRLLPWLTSAITRHPTATRRLLFAAAVVTVYAAAYAVDTLAPLVAPLL